MLYINYIVLFQLITKLFRRINTFLKLFTRIVVEVLRFREIMMQCHVCNWHCSKKKCNVKKNYNLGLLQILVTLLTNISSLFFTTISSILVTLLTNPISLSSSTISFTQRELQTPSLHHTMNVLWGSTNSLVTDTDYGTKIMDVLKAFPII